MTTNKVVTDREMLIMKLIRFMGPSFGIPLSEDDEKELERMKKGIVNLSTDEEE